MVPAAVLALAVLAEKMWRAIHAILLDAAVVASSADDARVLALSDLKLFRAGKELPGKN